MRSEPWFYWTALVPIGLFLQFFIQGSPSWLIVVCNAFQIWSGGMYMQYLFWDDGKFSYAQFLKRLKEDA